MSGVSFQIGLKGLKETNNVLQSFAKAVGGDAELHRRWGIQGLNWIDQNFRQSGALTGTPWAPLSPNTIAGRRQQSSAILQDTGLLRKSFEMTFSRDKTILGSNVEYALFHEYGTNPYVIKAKNLRGIRGIIPGRLVFMTTNGLVFAREVNHPGLKARRMLPRQTDDTFMEKLLLTTINYYNELQDGG